jgi:hypothetical protein
MLKNGKQINTPPSEQNVIKRKTNKYPAIRAKCNKMNKNKYSAIRAKCNKMENK